MTPPLKIGIVAGEESGDMLGADLVAALSRLSGREVELVGVGGRHLQARGLKTLFPPQDIALMGVTAVLADLPRLMLRIGRTARAIAAETPDCLITIDSPAFGLRVAKKLRATHPSMRTVHYVCPSVWAWAPGRARKMADFIDLILCLLPFETEELVRLGGPAGVYVGHRLASEPGILSAAAANAARRPEAGALRQLLVLPGSRRGEVKRLLAPFGETVRILHGRGNRFRVMIPTVPHVASMVTEATASWPVEREIIVDAGRKWQAYGMADAAIAASGTVTLELALARIPFSACYITDPLWRLAMRLITVWSASLPNLIADRPVVPEYYNEMLRPATVARQTEQLMNDTSARAAQMDGFRLIAERMMTARPSGELAADAVLTLLDRQAESM